MKELDPFSIRPDLGGTAYNFVKEISPDKIAFYAGEDPYLTTIVIPD